MTPRTDAATPLAGPGAAQAPSVAAARRALAAQLRGRGIDSPELDARILVGHALGLDHAALNAADRRILSAAESDMIAALGRRRLGHEPVARIVGRKEFWSLPLRVDAATLVPRPETETVVEATLAAIDARGRRSQAWRLADLGTGSGALLLALLTELENSFGIGSDLNPAALQVARGNARRVGLTRAAFVACDMLAALSGPFDVVVSNPPYIASGDIAALAPEVRDFEPRLALDGGCDGLDCYRMMAAAVPALLALNGLVVVELGSGQAKSVAALFDAAGLALSTLRPDLNGIPRALVAIRGA
jgi:release factor glutamine methyltransferase